MKRIFLSAILFAMILGTSLTASASVVWTEDKLVHNSCAGEDAVTITYTLDMWGYVQEVSRVVHWSSCNTAPGQY